jgi:hypothetical protein
METSAEVLVVDLTAVTFLASSGLAVLIRTAHAGGRATAAAVSTPVPCGGRWEITGRNQLFDLYPDRAAALLPRSVSPLRARKMSLRGHRPREETSSVVRLGNQNKKSLKQPKKKRKKTKKNRTNHKTQPKKKTHKPNILTNPPHPGGGGGVGGGGDVEDVVIVLYIIIIEKKKEVEESRILDI